MIQQPTLETPRLLLRAFRLADAPTLAKVAGRREIADTTISVPHPYSEAQARDWIATHGGRAERDEEVVFAITARPGGELIGAIGLRDISLEHSQTEMGFWIGVEWWGKGFASEAARAVLDFAFEQLRLNRVHAHHMLRNPASGRVLEKIGMQREGLLRQRVRKWGRFEDVAICAILQEEWRAKRSG